jgi:regulator of protease activity HflC (stomatin/prohibitin superfamily)
MFKRYTTITERRDYSGEPVNTEELNAARISIDALTFIVVFALIYMSVYTIQEGSVGIVKRFGEAVNQVNPGLHFKIPFIDNVIEIDVRTRKYRLQLPASTTGKNKATGAIELQVPSTLIISANWNIPKENAMSIYQEYGSLQQYEDKILDPRVIRSTKATIAKYSIESLIAKREMVSNDLQDVLLKSLADFKGTLTEINIEDVALPAKVRGSIEAKQVAKQNFQTEKYTLDKQNLVAQREVNSAKASAESVTIRANAQAQAIIAVGQAEAKSIKAKSEALKANPLIIELTKAESWDGKVPRVSLGGNTPIIFNSKEIGD